MSIVGSMVKRLYSVNLNIPMRETIWKTDDCVDDIAFLAAKSARSFPLMFE